MELSQTSTKEKNMLEIVFDPSQPLEKREKGADNLVYLARERTGGEMLFLFHRSQAHVKVRIPTNRTPKVFDEVISTSSKKIDHLVKSQTVTIGQV
jgi:hypothetical protein